MQSKRLTSLIVGALALLAPAASASAHVEQVPGWQQSELQRGKSGGSYAQRAFNTTNEQRVNSNLRQLAAGKCLHRFAVKQARKMAAQQQIFHQELGAIQSTCSMGWVGENVAAGYPNGRALVRKGWMKSEGHRANILNQNFRRMGLAVRQGSDGVWYAAQVFGTKL
jgi:uncharacterized protein YkwD